MGEIDVPIATKPKRAAATVKPDNENDDDNEMLDVFGDNEAKDEQDKDDEDDALEEDECACLSLSRCAPLRPVAPLSPLLLLILDR